MSFQRVHRRVPLQIPHVNRAIRGARGQVQFTRTLADTGARVPDNGPDAFLVAPQGADGRAVRHGPELAQSAPGGRHEHLAVGGEPTEADGAVVANLASVVAHCAQPAMQLLCFGALHNVALAQLQPRLLQTVPSPASSWQQMSHVKPEIAASEPDVYSGADDE